MITDGTPLVQATSVNFNKSTREFKVKSKVGTTVILTDQDGKELADNCTTAGALTTIDVEDLPAGTYLLKLTNGSETLTVRIKL